MGQKRYYENEKRVLITPTNFNVPLRALTRNDISGFAYIPGIEVDIGGKKERASLGLAVLRFLGKLPKKGLTEQEIKQRYQDYSRHILNEWINKDLKPMGLIEKRGTRYKRTELADKTRYDVFVFESINYP